MAKPKDRNVLELRDQGITVEMHLGESVTVLIDGAATAITRTTVQPKKEKQN